jgi:hypothetical protein
MRSRYLSILFNEIKIERNRLRGRTTCTTEKSYGITKKVGDILRAPYVRRRIAGVTQVQVATATCIDGSNPPTCGDIFALYHNSHLVRSVRHCFGQIEIEPATYVAIYKSQIQSNLKCVFRSIAIL